MRIIYIVLTVLFFSMSNIVVAQNTVPAPKKEVQKTIYTCPMHPKEVSAAKGKCTKCGMDLVATKEKKATAKQSKYVCTMDNSTADKPGKCPKCGMAMTERKLEKK